MSGLTLAEIRHHMTPETMSDFIQSETEKGASDNMIRRFKGTLKVIYDYLPEDKCITKDRLLAWRKSMEDNGYASITILNYVKYVNRYLDFVGCSEIRFNKGKAKDITDMTFGYLTAIEPTGARNRGDIVWRFRCQCKNIIELPATRVLSRNTLSCGCLKGARLKKVNKYYDGTSLMRSITEVVESTRAVSGYVGVTPKRDKWQAYITYKGVHYSLGCYRDIVDAIKARATAKALVIADAQGLLDFYTELEKTLPQLPNKSTEPKKEFQSAEWTVNDTPYSMAKRSDNKSGYTGVYVRNGKWEARICYQGVRYILGRFEAVEDAAQARKNAEQTIKDEPKRFVEECAKRHVHYQI